MAQTAINPQTGERVALVDGQWVPIGGLSFSDRVGQTPNVVPLDGEEGLSLSPADVSWLEQFGRAAVNSAGEGTVTGVGGALRMAGFEDTGAGLVDFGESLGLEPAGVQTISDIDGPLDFSGIGSYAANMLGQGVGSIAGVLLPTAAGAAAGSLVAPGPGTVAGGLGGAFLGSTAIQGGQLYNDLRARGLSHEDVAGLSALAGGAMGILDVAGLRAILPGLKGAVREAVEDVVRMEAERGLVGTAVRTGLGGAAKEGATEVSQQGIQEGATAYADPNYDPSQLLPNMADAFFGGAFGGGAFGVAGAPAERGRYRRQLSLLEQAREQAALKTARDRETSGMLALPPPSMTPEQRRREEMLAPARQAVGEAQDTVTQAEARLAAYPGEPNEIRLGNAQRRLEAAQAEYERAAQTDIFASGPVEPWKVVAPQPVVGAPSEPLAPSEPPPRALSDADMLRIKVESIDRNIRTLKSDLKKTPGHAPTIAKLRSLESKREEAVAALGPNPAQQLAGTTSTLRGVSPDTDIQTFARETARKIRGSEDPWVPFQESPNAPVTGYVNYRTGEMRTPEQHLAPIATPLSGFEPVIADPEKVREAASLKKDAAKAAESVQDAQKAEQRVAEQVAQKAVQQAQDAPQAAATQEGESEEAPTSAPLAPVGTAPVAAAVAPAAPAPASAPTLPNAPQPVAQGATETVTPAPVNEPAIPLTQAPAVVNETPVAAAIRQAGAPVATPRDVGRTHTDIAILPDGSVVTHSAAVDDEALDDLADQSGAVFVNAPRAGEGDYGVITMPSADRVTPQQRAALDAIRRENDRLPFDTYVAGQPQARLDDAPAEPLPSPTDDVVSQEAPKPARRKPLRKAALKKAVDARAALDFIRRHPPADDVPASMKAAYDDKLLAAAVASNAATEELNPGERSALADWREQRPDQKPSVDEMTKPGFKAMRPTEEGAEPEAGKPADLPEGHAARIAKAETDIRAMLKRMTGKDVDFSIVGEPLIIGGEKAVGGYNTQTGAIVVSAFSDAGHAYSPEFLTGFTRHEAIHWMKDHGLFPNGAWAALEKSSAPWMKRFKIKERYPDLTPEEQREEAIAEAYRAWSAGKLRTRGGPIQTAFEFIKRFFDTIRRLFGANGFGSAEDIFRGVDAGRFANPDAAKGIGPTSEWTMLRIGPTPTAPVTRSIEDEMRAGYSRVLGMNRIAGDTRTARAIGSFVDRTRGFMQDYLMPFRRAIEAVERTTGQPVPYEWNPVLVEEKLTGTVGHFMNDADRLHRIPVEEMMQKHKITEDELNDYLEARHAEERNVQIAKINPKLPDGGSGITTAEARATIARMEKGAKGGALKEIQRHIVEMSNMGLDALVAAGRKSAESVQRIKEMYPNYVNLSGIEDPDVEHDPAQVLRTGQGFMGWRGDPVKRATGRFSRAPDIRAHTYAEFDRRIAVAQKNLVAQALFNLAANNPDPALWTVAPVERRARINPTTGMVSYVMQQDVGADVVHAYVDGDAYAVRFNTSRDEGKRMYEAFAKLDGLQVNRAGALMMRVNQLLSRLNTTLNPEFMITAPVKDWQEAGINLQQYGVKRVASKTAAHVPGAMKAAWRYMNHKEPGGEWDRWAREFAAGGGMTYFPGRKTADDYVKQFNAEAKRNRRNPYALTKRMGRTLFETVEHANNAADMGTRLAAYRTLVEAGMPKTKAISAAKNLTVNFTRRGSMGPVLNSFFMFFNASVQGTATMFTAMKRSNLVKGLVLGVVTTGIIQEMVMSMMSPPDPDDPSRTVYDAIPEYVKQRNLILWINDDGSYVTFPKPWGYGFFHDVGRVMTRYLRGAPMGVGRPASVLDSVRDMGVSFANAFVPPGFDSVLPVPTVVAPIMDVVRNKDFAGRAIAPERMPGDQRPNSQMYFPGESPVTVEMASLLNRMTGGDDYRAGLVDISPEAMTHVWQAYGGAALGFYSRAADTLWSAGAETLGFNRQDPDLDWNDIPFGRKVVGELGSWQVRDLTYQRIADVELLEDEIAGYQEQGDRARALELRRENGPLVALAKEGRRLRRALGELRRERQGLLDGDLPTSEARARIDAIQAREDEMMRRWNEKYARALARTAEREN